MGPLETTNEDNDAQFPFRALSFREGQSTARIAEGSFLP